MPPFSVSIAPVGPVSVATMLVRENGQLSVVAIVKASFSFEHHRAMSLAPPEPIVTREIHRMNNPTRSVVATSDLVPRLPGVDVLFMGQAYTTGANNDRVTARLQVGRGEEVLLDKKILVLGDAKGSTILPFRSIPLVYEKAYGGPGYRENPLGTGVLAGDPPPNLVDPNGEKKAVAFAPIARTWPARSSLITAEVRTGLDGPICEVPPGFDYKYFHSAPPDQRLSNLLGDEWVVLENLNPHHPTLHLFLPSAQGMVKLVGRESPRVFSLRADTLRIDGDSQKCAIVWRNSFRIQESELGQLRLLGGVALPDLPIQWPEEALPLPETFQPQNTEGTQRVGSSGTLVLQDSESPPTFNKTMEVADEDIESVHFDAPDDFAKTAILASTAIPATAPFPSFVQKTPPVNSARPARRGPHESTMDLSDYTKDEGPPSMPFVPNIGQAETRSPPSEPIPGSPWDPDRSGTAPPEDSPTFDVEGALLSGTLVSTQEAKSGDRTVEIPENLLPPENDTAVQNAQAVSDTEQPPPSEHALAVARAASPAPPPVEPIPNRASGEAPPTETVAAKHPVEPQANSERVHTAGDPWGKSLGEAAVESTKPESKPASRPVDSTPKLKEALYKRFKKT
ncbi:MAG: DUF2169 domain-containing protein [Polyangiaceae bacterium]|nr:DUF2169 domain-containing protein [Polyangiaceae bacterium]